MLLPFLVVHVKAKKEEPAIGVIDLLASHRHQKLQQLLTNRFPFPWLQLRFQPSPADVGRESRVFSGQVALQQ